MKKLEHIDPDLLKGNPRASFSAWKKYESLVLAAYRIHPQPYIYRPTNMAPSTVCTRLRDAVRGKLAFDYPIELVDAPTSLDLSRWYSEVIFKYDKEQVFIGPPETVHGVLTGTQVGNSRTKQMVYESLTFEEVSAFSLLLSGGRIEGPVLIKSPPDLTLLPDRPNTEKMTKPDGSLVLF